MVKLKIEQISPIDAIGAFSVWPLPKVENWFQNQIWNEKVHISILKKKWKYFDQIIKKPKMVWTLWVWDKESSCKNLIFSGGLGSKNPCGLRPLGFWPRDLPRHSIHHDTAMDFSNNVPIFTSPVCHVSHFLCHVSCVMSYVSHVTWHQYSQTGRTGDFKFFDNVHHSRLCHFFKWLGWRVKYHMSQKINITNLNVV